MRYLTILCVILCGSSCGFSEGAEEASLSQSFLLEQFGKLENREFATRISALESIEKSREETSSFLIEKLKRADKKREISFLDTTYLTVASVAEYRIVEAVPLLVERLNVRIAPSTMGAGINYTPDSFYPFAGTLVAVGGKQLVSLILNKIGESDDEELIRLCAWVLSEHLGRTVAVFVVEEHLESIEGESVESRYNKVKELLEAEELILRNPRWFNR